MLFGEEDHLEGMTSLNGNSLDRFRNQAFSPCREIGNQRNTAAEHSRQLSSQSLEEAQIDIEGH